MRKFTAAAGETRVEVQIRQANLLPPNPLAQSKARNGTGVFRQRSGRAATSRTRPALERLAGAPRSNGTIRNLVQTTCRDKVSMSLTGQKRRFDRLPLTSGLSDQQTLLPIGFFPRRG